MAEELIELGRPKLLSQSSPSVPSVGRRMVAITAAEADILIRTADAIADFSNSFGLEFSSYCPVERWGPVLQEATRSVSDMRRQLQAGKSTVQADAGAIMAIMDLEECTSGARDRRLSSSKIALGLSAMGAVGEIFLGLPWLGVPTYIISLALILGRPLAARYKPNPSEPFQPNVLMGRFFPSRNRLGQATEEEDDSGLPKLIERVIVSRDVGVQRHYWGQIWVTDKPGEPRAFCLSKGDFRIRVEGRNGDVVTHNNDWTPVPEADCIAARNEIGVWQPCGPARTEDVFGPIPEKSAHEATFWVEYIGPLTDGICRRAGPFGCTCDTKPHAMEDGAITNPGVDGHYEVFDVDGNSVEKA